MLLFKLTHCCKYNLATAHKIVFTVLYFFVLFPFYVAAHTTSDERRSDLILEDAETLERKADSLKLSRQYLKALDFYLKSMFEYEKGKSFESLITVNEKVADLYKEWGIYEKAVEYYSKALDSVAIKDKKNTPKKVELLNNRAYSFFRNNELDKAAEDYVQVLKLIDAQESPDLYVSILKSLSIVYEADELFVSSLNCQLEVLELEEKRKNNIGQAVACNNIGVLYKRINKLDKALFYLFKSRDFYFSEQQKNKLEHYESLSKIFTEIGLVYMDKGENSTAIQSFQQALDVNKILRSPKEQAKLLTLISQAHYKLGNFKEAEETVQQALVIAEKYKDYENLVQCYKVLSTMFEHKNQHTRALKFYKYYLTYKDSADNRFMNQLIDDFRSRQLAERKERETSLQIRDLEIQNLELNQYKIQAEQNEKDLKLLIQKQEFQNLLLQNKQLEESRKLELKRRELQLREIELEQQNREKQIELLKKDSKIKMLALNKKELDAKERTKAIAMLTQEKKIRELQLKKERNLRIYFIGSISLLFVLVAVSAAAFYNKKRANELLEKQNQHIHEQKEEINQQKQLLEYNQTKLQTTLAQLNDSINYAKIIQDAIMPNVQDVKNYLPDFFTFYLPRDIVSGDFFWFDEIKGKLILAAADCTGHGVPGAIMSTMGGSLLNQIVSENKVTEPHLILQQLNKGISSILLQKGSNKDNYEGMEIALVTIDLSSHTLWFAGAKRPLYYFNKQEMIEIKGNNHFIGWRQETTFDLHRLSVKKGDRFFMFSDGYADQLGEKTGKRLTTKNFSLWLKEIAVMPAEAQERELRNRFFEWKGTMQQLDDVMVLGFSIPK
jgi:serine phosphatase RsbU (regulator of sigma subunit)/tetratricopeptide (TPR) repeat protein